MKNIDILFLLGIGVGAASVLLIEFIISLIKLKLQ